jgi:hypothetical protein
VEGVFILVFFMRQKVEYHRTRAMAQAAIDHKGDDALKAFQEFYKASFPYERQARMKNYATQMDVLQQWVKQGALAMTPQMLPRGPSPQLARGTAALRNREAQEKAGLLKKM